MVLGTAETGSTHSGRNPETFRPGKLLDPTDEHRWHYWSIHQGGATFLMADGSVHFLTYKIGQNILNAYATYKGGEAVEDPD